MKGKTEADTDRQTERRETEADTERLTERRETEADRFTERRETEGHGDSRKGRHGDTE